MFRVKVRDIHSNKFIYEGEVSIGAIAEAIKRKALKINDRYYIEFFGDSKRIGAFVFENERWLENELFRILKGEG